MLLSQPTRHLCKSCGEVPAKANGISRMGFTMWHRYCVSCARGKYDPKFEHLLNKTSVCAECEFMAKDSCQLVLIPIDGDAQTKKEDNLKTVCLNCAVIRKKQLQSNKKLDITSDSVLGIGQF